MCLAQNKRHITFDTDDGHGFIVAFSNLPAFFSFISPLIGKSKATMVPCCNTWDTFLCWEYCLHRYLKRRALSLFSAVLQRGRPACTAWECYQRTGTYSFLIGTGRWTQVPVDRSMWSPTLNSSKVPVGGLLARPVASAQNVPSTLPFGYCRPRLSPFPAAPPSPFNACPQF